MKDESQKYISIIFKEWLPLYDSLTPEVKAVLKNIAGQQAEALGKVRISRSFLPKLTR